MTLNLLVCLIGLVLWLIFTKVKPEAWVAELGRLCFFAGLLAYLFNVGSRTVF